MKKTGDNVGTAPNDDYLSSLYFVFTTMTTVGYGDIRPHTTSERIYVALLMFLGASVFGYIAGCVAADFGTKAEKVEMISRIFFRRPARTARVSPELCAVVSCET